MTPGDEALRWHPVCRSVFDAVCGQTSFDRDVVDFRPSLVPVSSPSLAVTRLRIAFLGAVPSPVSTLDPLIWSASSA